MKWGCDFEVGIPDLMTSMSFTLAHPQFTELSVTGRPIGQLATGDQKDTTGPPALQQKVGALSCGKTTRTCNNRSTMDAMAQPHPLQDFARDQTECTRAQERRRGTFQRVPETSSPPQAPRGADQGSQHFCTQNVASKTFSTRT